MARESSYVGCFLSAGAVRRFFPGGALAGGSAGCCLCASCRGAAGHSQNGISGDSKGEELPATCDAPRLLARTCSELPSGLAKKESNTPESNIPESSPSDGPAAELVSAISISWRRRCPPVNGLLLWPSGFSKKESRLELPVARAGADIGIGDVKNALSSMPCAADSEGDVKNARALAAFRGFGGLGGWLREKKGWLRVASGGFGKKK